MNFPTSHFKQEDLECHADRFKIPSKFFNADHSPQVRSAMIFTEEEQRYIQQELTNQAMKETYEVYYNLTSFDAYFLVPRWPLTLVMELLNMRRSQASALKRICNTMNNIGIEEYNKRVAAILQEKEATPEYMPTNIPIKRDTSDLNAKLAQMRKYLNPKQCLKMPKDIGALIHEVPEYMVKRAWVGSQFTTQYKKMKAFYAV